MQPSVGHAESRLEKEPGSLGWSLFSEQAAIVWSRGVGWAGHTGQAWGEEESVFRAEVPFDR